MSHPINDMVKESLYERFHDMTLLQFVAWLETHKDTDDVAQRVYFSLDKNSTLTFKEVSNVQHR